MEYRKLGGTGLRISAISLGTGGQWGGRVKEPEAKQIVAAALDGGINYIDTANIYGSWWDGKPLSEEILGKALVGIREDILLGSKGCQKLGEGQPLGARFGANVALKKCLGIMLGIGTLLFLFPAALIRLFTSDPEIIRLGSTVLRIGAFEQPFLGSYMVLAGSLRGAGDTMRPMLVAILGSWIFRVPLVYFLAVNCGLGLPGVWLGTCLDWLFRAAAMFVLFRRGKWLEKKV